MDSRVYSTSALTLGTCNSYSQGGRGGGGTRGAGGRVLFQLQVSEMREKISLKISAYFSTYNVVENLRSL